MSAIIKEFDRYLIDFNTPQWGSTRAVIHCYKGFAKVGSITFRNEASQLTDSTQFNFVLLEFHEKSFSNIMDILRNERPLYLKYQPAHNRGWLATTLEAVGEEES